MPRRRGRVRQAAARVAVLSVGINYFGQRGQLRGCVNDSNNFVAMLRTRYGPHLAEVVQMVDTAPSTGRLYPTRKNIEGALRYFARQCARGRFTHFLLHYSGHGAQVRDRSGDERDGRDEVLVPVDFRRRGMISDDWLVRRVVNVAAKRAKTFALIDACHSGSAMDLRYMYDRRKGWQQARRPQSDPKAMAMMISGSRDDQVSYDVYDATYGPSGAMTTAFLRATLASPRAPIWHIVLKMRAELERRRYPQRPQLTSTGKFKVGREPIFALGELA